MTSRSYIQTQALEIQHNAIHCEMKFEKFEKYAGTTQHYSKIQKRCYAGKLRMVRLYVNVEATTNNTITILTPVNYVKVLQINS